jgi:transcriptional regulator with XRE-family HTH domain
MKLLEQIVLTYKMRNQIRTDTEVARKLGLGRSALSNYKTGERKLPDMAIAELADGVDLPVEDVLAAANLALNRTTAEERQYWVERIADSPLGALLRMRENQGFSLLAKKALMGLFSCWLPTTARAPAGCL